MTENERRRPDKISMSLCYRIERLCSQFTISYLKESNSRLIKDRRIVDNFYHFYRTNGDDGVIAIKKAKANAIRVILTDELT